MTSYNRLGNFAISLLDLHNPALTCSPEKEVSDPKMMDNKLIRIGLLYLRNLRNVHSQIPHQNVPRPDHSRCKLCNLSSFFSIHNIIAMVPHGISEPDVKRGSYHPYLGSSTSETTSLIQSWEKDTDITFLRKAGGKKKIYQGLLRSALYRLFCSSFSSGGK